MSSPPFLKQVKLLALYLVELTSLRKRVGKHERVSKALMLSILGEMALSDFGVWLP